MKFSPTTVCIAALAVASCDATSIKMDFLPIGHVRTDPILSKTCLSGHVHSFYGANVLPHPATFNYDALRAVGDSDNTGNVVENKSVYWHPSIYSYDPTTDTYTRQEMAQTSAYYIWVNGQGTKAFPNGFEMIGSPGPGRFARAEAECAGSLPSTRPACPASFGDMSFFPSQACQELEASMTFPSCWDGVNLSSANGQDHVAYTIDGDVESPCPPEFPVRIPQIKFFFRIMPYAGGCHVFSDMSQVFHADYVSGWNETFLQQVLDECSNDSLTSSPDAFCENHVTFRDAPKCTDESTGCSFGDPELLDKLRNIQPPALDMTAITTEETKTVVGTLPGGPDFQACNGSLLPPTTATTLSPSPYPSFFPGDGDDDEAGGGTDDEAETDDETGGGNDDEVETDDETGGGNDDETETDDSVEEGDDETDPQEDDEVAGGSDDEMEESDDMEEPDDDMEEGDDQSEPVEDDDEEVEEPEEDDDEGEGSGEESDEDESEEEDFDCEAECSEFLEWCHAECDEEVDQEDVEECKEVWCADDFETCRELLGC